MHAMKLNQKGMSFVEVLLAAGVGVTVMSMSFYLLMKSTQIKQKTEKTKEAWYVLSDSLSRGKKVFLDVKDSRTGKHSQGICDFMSTETPGYGVGLIRLDLTPDGIGQSLTRRWSKYFSTDYSNGGAKCSASGDLERCFTPKQNILDSMGGKFKSNEVSLKVKVTPISLAPTENQGLFKPITGSLKSIDVKTVGFLIKSEVNYRVTIPDSTDKTSDQAWRTDSSSSVIWAADVSYCDFESSEGTIQLYPSGTGLGDTTGKVQYNRTNFNAKDVEPLNIIVQKKVIQAGILNNGRVQTDANKNIEISCNETAYRCANSNEKRTYANSLFIEALINYAQPNKVTGRGNVPVSLDLQIIDSGRRNLLNKYRPQSTVTWDNGTYKKVGDKYYLIDDDGKTTKQPMTLTGSHNLRYDMSQVTSMCSEICSQSRIAKGVLSYYPAIRYTLHDVTIGTKGAVGNYSDQFISSSPVGCTACYMKNCSRFGLDTFGPMTKQPFEPLDSVIPECAMNESEEVQKLSMTDHSVVKGLSAGTCIAARVTSTGFAYEARSCSEKLPVLCYNYGKHLLAQKVTGTSSSFVKGSFAQGSRICYEMGREKVVKAKLSELFDQQGVSKSGLSGLPSTFVNNAKQGLFIAPQNSRHIADSRRWLVGKQNVGSRRFWVNLNQDKSGKVYAPPAEMSSRNVAGESYSLYYKSGRIKLTKNSLAPKPIFSSVSGARGAILFNDVRFKGVVVASADLPSSQKFEFLCRKRSAPHELFVTKNSKSSRLQDGASACARESGYFIPPMTSLQWVKALHLVSPHAVDLPFTDPESQIAPNGVWVAMSKVSGTQWKLPNSLDIEQKFLSTIKAGKTTEVVDRSGVYLVSQPSGKSSKSSSASAPSVDFNYIACQNERTAEIEFYRSPSRCKISQKQMKNSDLQGLVSRVFWTLAARRLPSNARIHLPTK